VAWGERAGWKHVEDIFDGGESGAKLDRAGVQRVIGLLRDERIDLVSFFKVDRAARRVGVKFVVHMPVPTDAEQYEGYLVQTS
jgi:hypothetical protein